MASVDLTLGIAPVKKCTTVTPPILGWGAGPPGTLRRLFYRQDRAPKGARLQNGNWARVLGFGMYRGMMR
jgi:hypothetical protein